VILSVHQLNCTACAGYSRKREDREVYSHRLSRANRETTNTHKGIKRALVCFHIKKKKCSHRLLPFGRKILQALFSRSELWSNCFIFQMKSARRISK
jgi:hypothetical protein